VVHLKGFSPKCAIKESFGATNPYKKFNEAQQHFLENFVLYICKGYNALSACENNWIQRLVL